MSKTNGINTPGGIPAMLKNPSSSEAGSTDSGESQSLLFCEPVVGVASSESSPSGRQQSEEIDMGAGRSGVQQGVDPILQQIEEEEAKEVTELQKCKALIKKMMMTGVSRQRNICMDVKSGLTSLEESLEVIEENLGICRQARQTLQSTAVGPMSRIGMTQTESTINKIEVATSPVSYTHLDVYKRQVTESLWSKHFISF